MSLYQTILHLLLEVLKPGTLPLVDLLVGCFHLARAELPDRLGMVIGIIHSLIDFIKVCLSSERCSSLDSHGGAHGGLLRRSRFCESLTVVIFGLEAALMVICSERDLLLMMSMLSMIFSMSISSHLIQNWIVQASKFARYLTTWRSSKDLWLI